MSGVHTVLGRHVPFAEYLGLNVTQHEKGRGVLELELRPELMNSFAVAHGGVVMTMADIALAVAARTMYDEPVGAVTIDLHVNFIEPGEGTLIAEGRCIRAGKSIVFCEGEVRDRNGKLVAKALGSFMVRRSRGGDG